MSASSAASILSCIFCKLLWYARLHSAYAHFPSVLGYKQSCERIDLKGALVLEENKDSQHWWRGESWWYWWFPVSPSVWLKRCLGTICIKNYFHLNHFCKFSHWIYTCLVNKQSALHQKLLSYYETLWEEKWEISGSWKVRHPQQCVVFFWQGLVYCLQGEVLDDQEMCFGVCFLLAWMNMVALMPDWNCRKCFLILPCVYK